MNNLNIHIDSEINELKSVVVHEPGFEFELVSPENKDHLLFDDIIYTETARHEHQQLCKIINKISKFETPCIPYSNLLLDIISEFSVRDNILNEINEYEKIDQQSRDILDSLDENNFIKAITRPYPGAFSFINKQKIMFWKAQPFDHTIIFDNVKLGEIVEKFSTGDFIVKCIDGTLLVTDYDGEVKKGDILCQ